MLTIKKIRKLKSRDGFCEIDLQFADLVIKLAAENDPILYLSAALVSHALQNSHNCIDLNCHAEELFPVYETNTYDNNILLPQIKLPELELWKKSLSRYPNIVSSSSYTPLILDDSGRLYMQKYWNYEKKLAVLLKSFKRTDYSGAGEYNYDALCRISNYFSNKKDVYNFQKLAVFTALINRMTVITGGPGTGKTTIVSVILSMMLDNNPKLNIKLCAPTGKAAARLKESITEEIENLNPQKISTRETLLNLETYTIHRLLGSRYLSTNFKYNEKQRLDVDLLIADEASMIHLSLFYKLIAALPDSAKLIILGDKDQLASVEAGAVLANMYYAGTPNYFTDNFIQAYKTFTGYEKVSLNYALKSSVLEDCIVELDKSYRFRDESDIGLVKKAVLQANSDVNAEEALQLTSSSSNSLILKALPIKNNFESKIKSYITNLKVRVENTEYIYKDYLKAPNVETAYRIFSNFRILCSHNGGLSGVENVNKILHKIILGNSKSAKGTPIIIRENCRHLELYNGDTGLIWTDEENVEKAYFPISDSNDMRAVSIAMLPAYQEVFAMTIHKSQGSGFQKILILMSEHDSPLLTKELVYTGITRAKKYCEIWSNNIVFKAAILRKTERTTGLYDRLNSQCC